MYRSVTDGIEVTVEPHYLERHSDPKRARYVWAYHVTISNQSDRTHKLLSRHWIITDGEGRREEVIGEGVIGEQPTLKPGETYTYTSGCPLTTPTGNMRGSYTMVDEHGNRRKVRIPLFFLRHPDTFH